MIDDDEIDHVQGSWPICDDSPLPAERIEEYAAKYGEERLHGYLHAARDFQKHFKRCFEGYKNNLGAYQQRIGAETMVKKLFHRNGELLKTYDDRQRQKDDPKIS